MTETNDPNRSNIDLLKSIEEENESILKELIILEDCEKDVTKAIENIEKNCKPKDKRQFLKFKNDYDEVLDIFYTEFDDLISAIDYVKNKIELLKLLY